MRAHRRHRPRLRTMVDPPPGIDLLKLAKRVRYVGSPEHKKHPSFAGQPRPRADASLCDPSLATTQTELTRWLQAGIRRGYVGAPWEGDYPRYVWHKVGDVVYEARLINRENGQYKGYPLRPEEYPQGLEGCNE